MLTNVKIYHAIRLTIGILFLVYGINDLFHINILPKSGTQQQAQNLLSAIVTTGYMFNFMKVVEITMGILFILNRCVPLVVISLLTPFVLNYFLFSLFLNPPGLPMAILALVGTSYFIIFFKDKYKLLLAMK